MGRFLIVLLFFIFIVGCENDDEVVSRKPGLDLVFSTDTILFDTLLTSRTSITKRLRITNPNDKAIELREVALAQSGSSPYNIIVNGKGGPSVENELIASGDSILILVEVEIDPQDEQLPYLVKDSLLVSWNERTENVKLIAWGLDANFISREIICDQTWRAGKPYVIMDTVLIDAQCVLTIEEGSQVLFDNNAAMFVAGQLLVNGRPDDHVIFRNTRFDINYIEAPGQWDAIYFLEGSSGNFIDHAIIENGRVGLRIGSPDEDTIADVTISHSIIRHMSQSGIQAFTSDLEMTNTLIYNAGSTTVLNAAGGNYSYDHCTFVNSPNFFFAEDPSVQIADNLVISDDELLVSPLNLSLRNSIIWGSGEEEFLLSITLDDNVLSVFNNIIRIEGEFGNNFTSLEDNFPGFNSPMDFNYSLDSLSFAIDKGLPGDVEDDILGLIRDNLPDIGAYEYSNN